MIIFLTLTITVTWDEHSSKNAEDFYWSFNMIGEQNMILSLPIIKHFMFCSAKLSYVIVKVRQIFSQIFAK